MFLPAVPAHVLVQWLGAAVTFGCGVGFWSLKPLWLFQKRHLGTCLFLVEMQVGRKTVSFSIAVKHLGHLTLLFSKVFWMRMLNPRSLPQWRIKLSSCCHCADSLRDTFNCSLLFIYCLGQWRCTTGLGTLYMGNDRLENSEIKLKKSVQFIPSWFSSAFFSEDVRGDHSGWITLEMCKILQQGLDKGKVVWGRQRRNKRKKNCGTKLR